MELNSVLSKSIVTPVRNLPHFVYGFPMWQFLLLKTCTDQKGTGRGSRLQYVGCDIHGAALQLLALPKQEEVAPVLWAKPRNYFLLLISCQ